MNEKGDFVSIQVKRTLPAQPWSNGLVERANGKIKNDCQQKYTNRWRKLVY